MHRNPFWSEERQSSSITRTTAHESVRERIRQAILSGGLPTGSRLVQSQIARQLGVSTTPVREALRDLASEGLVEFDSFRGAVVHEPTLDEVEDVYEIRTVLEPIAIRRAVARISDQHLARAEALMEEMEQESDPVAWVGLNRQFHAILLQAGVSKRLEGILRTLNDAATAYIALSLALGPHRMATANAGHQDLLEAYRRRDVDEAVDVATRHLAGTVEIIREALSGEEQTSIDIDNAPR